MADAEAPHLAPIRLAMDRLAREEEAHLAVCPRCRAQRRIALDFARSASAGGGPGAHSVPEPAPRAPSRYTCVRLLGAGSFGSVWEAHDGLTGDRVAIKFISDVLAHPDQVRRERATLRLLALPGTVRLLDEGQTGDAWFLVMEAIQGEHFPGSSFDGTWRSIQSTVVGLLETLHRVHGRGILHRDVKPSNVLVRADGTATLLDFGCASGRWHGPADGTVAGTPRYMAPELLAGAEPDARADLYAVGVMLYEALDGAAPHDDAPSWTALAELKRTVRPRRLQGPPDLPAAMRLTITSLVAHRVDERPGNVLDVLRVLTPPPAVAELPEDLQSVFEGPERIFHVPSMAARALTQRAVDADDRAFELEAWRRAGIAWPRGSRWTIDRHALRRLAVELPLRALTLGPVSDSVRDRLSVLSANAFGGAVLAHADDLLARGRVTDACSLVGEALTRARTGAGSIPLDLLAARVALGFEEGTERGLEEALYELGRWPLADVRPLERLASAGLAAYRGRADEALAELRDLTPASSALRFWRVAAQVIAARSLGADRERELIDEVRRSADTERLVEASDEWQARLGYRDGRYAEAAASLRALAERRARPQDRLSALLNGASAALEAGRWDEVDVMAQEARGISASLLLPMFEARAEWLLRASACRSGRNDRVDVELVELVAELDLAQLEGLVALTEAGAARALGDRRLTRELATRAARVWGRTGGSAGQALAASLAAASGGEVTAEEASGLVARAWTAPSPELGVQIAALVGVSCPDLPQWKTAVVELAARVADGRRRIQLEVLSVEEALDLAAR